MPDSVTQILNSGPPGTKFNIAVLGDGFAEADQAAYNNKVQEMLLDGVFGHDYFYEDRQAYNIYRVNLISADSGVSTKQYDEKGTPNDPSDDTVISTNMRNTALGYIYSGSWAHCWLEGSADTGTRVDNALNHWVPDRHLVVVILNTNGFGGCGGGGFQIVTMGVDWTVLAHEFGHGTGGLADEYCTTRVYSGGEPGSVNLTTNTNRATLKWGRFVNPVIPLPTGTGDCAGYTAGSRPAGWSDAHDVGLFEGGGTNSRGIYRPVMPKLGALSTNVTPGILMEMGKTMC
jgi:IgA Peptidase M64